MKRILFVIFCWLVVIASLSLIPKANAFFSQADSSAAEEVIGYLSATGGTVTWDDRGYTFHTFTSNGTFAITDGVGYVQVLVIGGGGAGHNNNLGGGGGAGGEYKRFTKYVKQGESYSITVGLGGDGVEYSSSDTATNGSKSIAFGVEARGGVRGKGGTNDVSLGGDGNSGALGSGAATSFLGGTSWDCHTGGTGDAGFNGGKGYCTDQGNGNYPMAAGGGAGCGGDGGDAEAYLSGAGGAGYTWPVNDTCYCGGGGGGTRAKSNDTPAGEGGTATCGGMAGRPRGILGEEDPQGPQEDGRGGGGAGTSGTNWSGDGSNGTVIIAFKNPDYAGPETPEETIYACLSAIDPPNVLLDVTDSTSYSGSGTAWTNLGSDGSNCDFTLDGLTFNGTAGDPAAYFSTDGSNSAYSAALSSCTVLDDAHQTDVAGRTVITLLQTPSSIANNKVIFGTSGDSTSSNRGISVRKGNASTTTLNQNDGGGCGSGCRVEDSASVTWTTDDDVFFAATWDGTSTTSNVEYFYDSDTPSATRSVTFKTVTSAASGQSSVWCVFGGGPGGSCINEMSTGARLYAHAVWDSILSDADIASARDCFEKAEHHNRTY